MLREQALVQPLRTAPLPPILLSTMVVQQIVPTLLLNLSTALFLETSLLMGLLEQFTSKAQVF